MHPETAITIATRRAEELCAEARAARLARQDRDRAAVASRPLAGFGSAAAAGGRNHRRRRLLGRPAPGRPQPA